MLGKRCKVRCIMVGGLGIVVSRVLLRLMGSLGGVMGISVMRILVVRLLVVNNLVVLGEGTGVTIVVVHLHDEAAIINIHLA